VECNPEYVESPSSSRLSGEFNSIRDPEFKGHKRKTEVGDAEFKGYKRKKEAQCAMHDIVLK